VGNEERYLDKQEGGIYYGYVVAVAGFGIWFITWGTYTIFCIFFRPVLTEFGWARADTVLAY